MNNKKFRLALLKAIDRKKLIPSGERYLIQNDSLIAPPLEGSQDPIPLHFNLTEAKTLLKESGVVINPKLKIKLISLSTEPSMTLAKAVQSQLTQNLGLNVELNAVVAEEYTTFMGLGDYTALVTTWTGKISNSIDFLLPYVAAFTNNRVHYFNSNYDDFLEDATAPGVSALEQKKLFSKAQKLLIADEGVLIPLCAEHPYALVHPNISNLYFDQLNVPHFNHAVIH